MTTVSALLRARMNSIGYDYPPIYLGAAWLAIVSGAVGALAQRYPFSLADGSAWAIAGGLLAICPAVANLAFGATSRVALAITEIAAVNLLLIDPVESTDITLGIVVATVSMVTATSSTRTGVSVAAAALLTFVVAGVRHGVDNPLPYAAAVLFSWTIGYLILVQSRLIRQQQLSQEINSARAATDERARIAREVHDVVAHTLTITLLELTGARRALQEDRDIDDAIRSLVDAEHLGRRAMADIRRTVRILGDGHTATDPEPGIADIACLVEDHRRAGMSVTLETSGNTRRVSPATGLALYRIAQESLANAAKHAPGSPVDVVLDVDTESTLAVRNHTGFVPLPVAAPDGSGIRGMRTRAQLLDGHLVAGPDGDGWAVRVEFAGPP